jgi:hypothetical protein
MYISSPQYAGTGVYMIQSILYPMKHVSTVHIYLHPYIVLMDDDSLYERRLDDAVCICDSHQWTVTKLLADISWLNLLVRNQVQHNY